MQLKTPFAKRSSLSKLALTMALPVMFGSAAAHAGTGWVGTETHAHPVGDAVARGSLQSGYPIHVTVALKLHDREGLDSFIGELTRPGSPAFGQHLSGDEFVARYAPSESEARAVADYLSRAGFVNIDIAPNRQLIEADGTAGVVEGAFKTKMMEYDVKGRSAIGNTTDISVPRELGGTVLAVLGLQTINVPHTMYKIADGAHTDSRGGGGGSSGSLVGHYAQTFPTIYGVGSTPKGTSTAIGIIAQGKITQTITDLATFESAAGITAVPTTTVTVGTSSTDTSGVVEWDLDSQSIVGMSGGVKSLVFYVVNSLTDANLTGGYNAAVTANAVKAINVSIGGCETSSKSDGSMASDDQIFSQAVAQGQVFSVSSGDSGSAECGRSAGESYPATSPYVVALGGTDLYTTSTTTYSSETAWVSGGGGPSVDESQPSWQSGVVSGTKRGVPDIAMDADPSSGEILYYGSKTEQVGGTSLSSPLFVGAWARFQSANNNNLVFPNPGFYSYAKSASLFTDVTSGNNGGNTAVAGWDYATGWGSLKLATDYAYISAHPGSF